MITLAKESIRIIDTYFTCPWKYMFPTGGVGGKRKSTWENVVQMSPRNVRNKIILFATRSKSAYEKYLNFKKTITNKVK